MNEQDESAYDHCLATDYVNDDVLAPEAGVAGFLHAMKGFWTGFPDARASRTRPWSPTHEVVATRGVFTGLTMASSWAFRLRGPSSGSRHGDMAQAGVD
jgi:hypothetical protein